MRSATRAGFRIAGLMAMTFLIAHCGDSSTHIRTGGGVNPSAGTFEGTLDRDGSTITVVVDSIRSIAFQCDTDDISQTFEPPKEVNADGIRVLSIFPGRTATPRMEKLFAKEGRAYKPELLLQPEDVAEMVTHALRLPRTAEVTDISIRPMQKSY